MTGQTTRTPTQPEPSRALVRDGAERMAGVHLEFDQRPVYDFLLSLATGADAGDVEYDILAEDRAWLSRSKAALSPERQQDLDDLFGRSRGGLGHGLGVVPVYHPDARTARQFVSLLATMSTRELAREMASDGLREPLTGLIDRALAGDETALEELPSRVAEYECVPLVELLRAPTLWLDKLRGLLADWLVAYEPIEARIEAMQRRDVALRELDRSRLTPADLIERTTGGLRWLPEPGVQRIILAPSYFSRPYNNVSAGADFRLFAYPLDEAALDRPDELAPPESVLRLYRALGDASRLRILRLLASRDLYLTEIAQQMELSKPTVKHHLAQLRAAGLVTVTEEGHLTYYSLRRARLAEAGPDLLRFLG